MEYKKGTMEKMAINSQFWKGKKVLVTGHTGFKGSSFDPKPKLNELDNQPTGKIDNPTANVDRKWLKSPWKFRQQGDSGLHVSELFPHIASCVDDIAVIRSMQADLPIHSTGVLFLHTGLNVAPISIFYWEF